MAISYEPLFETMKNKGKSSYALIKDGFSKQTYYNMKSKGLSVSTNTIDHLCTILDCEVSDVIAHVKDEQSKS